MKFAAKTGSSLSLMNGCKTFKLVLNPIFSALANDSSVVPTFKHESLNFLKSMSSENLSHSGWSGEIAKNVAPKIVSGLVVNTFIKLSLFLI